MSLAKQKHSEPSEMLTHQRPFSRLVIWSVITDLREALGGPVSSRISIGSLASVSRVFCLPWNSRETELAEEVGASNPASEWS
jgi:hypothetical protein